MAEETLNGKLWRWAAVALGSIVFTLIGIIYAKDTTSIDTTSRGVGALTARVTQLEVDSQDVKGDIKAIKVEVESLKVGQLRIERKVDDAFQEILRSLRDSSGRDR